MAAYTRLEDEHELEPMRQKGPNIETPALDDHLTIFAKIAKYRKVSWIVLASMSGILLYGYDFSIVSTVASIKPFQERFGEIYNGKLILPGAWLSAWTAASPLGSTSGALVGGYIADKLGRRMTVAIGYTISATGVAISCVSGLPRSVVAARSLFMVAKIINGFGIGMSLVTTQTYLSEIVPTVLRGPAMAVIPIATLLGQLIGAGVITALSGHLKGSAAYLAPLLSQFAFALLPFVFAFFAPESPTWLLRRGKFEAAVQSNQRLCPQGTNARAVTVKLRISVEEEHGKARKSSASFLDCFKGTDRRRTFVVLLAYSSTELWGLTLLANASYFLQVLGLPVGLSLIVLLAGIVCGLLSNIASIWTLSRFARRQLILYSLAAATVLWTSAGIANCFPGKASAYYTIAALMSVIMIVGVGAWPAFYAVGAEVSSQRLRAVSQGIGWAWGAAASFVASLILPLLYSEDAGNLKGKTTFVYTGLCGLCLVLSWFFVPELKDRPPQDIDRMFELGLPARNFDRWQSGS